MRELTAVAERLNYYIVKPEGRHRAAVRLLMLFYAAIIISIAAYGFDYYRLPLARRAFHPLNQELRPSGVIGIRLALLAVASFVCIYLYAIRKRWRWLGSIGKTRNWLDVHVVLGVSAPILVTFHAAFKMRGVAGAAYWIMIAVTLSGVVGRYLYAQIPRRINAAELSLQEMQAMTEELAESLHEQSVVSAEELKPLLAVPSKEEVDKLPVAVALLLMFVSDVQRPFLVARVRRRALTVSDKIRTLWGLLPSHQVNLEKVIDLARRRSWISTKISFLARTHQVFNLWHVVHRPFSYAFAILICVHIGVALLMGYF
jgi:hypothetical protein